ncbi:MAG: phage integrase N-terminal SAM-like domain-containing protein, partial [Bacillota bacterium]
MAVALVREVAGVLASFGAALRSRGLSEKSVVSYLGQVRRFAAWYEGACGQFDPAAVSQLDVAEYRRWMQAKGCKPATVNLALVALGRFFSWAVEEGICSFDPAAGVKRVPEQVPGPRWLD